MRATLSSLIKYLIIELLIELYPIKVVPSVVLIKFVKFKLVQALLLSNTYPSLYLAGLSSL
jgi:hypothetical protein